MSAITWTLVNANGVTNTGPGAVVAQGWNLLDPYHITNWFQCVDLPLALGTNWISIQATDLAGLVAVTNFAYVFDTNGDTTPPSLALVWPQNGALVSGGSLAVQAWTDDDTATVALQYTDTNGVLDTLNAVVERGGSVWVSNVPLTAGTNIFTLVATDAAGNVNTTTFSVVQSSMTLTVKPLSQTDMQSGYVTVSGMGPPNCLITVNGVQTTSDQYGNWTVSNVPLPTGGTVTLQVTAQLPDGTTLQTMLEEVRGPIVFTQNYTYNLDYTSLDWSEGQTNLDTFHIAVQWTRGAGGTMTQTYSTVNVQTLEGTSNTTVTVWPPDSGYLPPCKGRR